MKPMIIAALLLLVPSGAAVVTTQSQGVPARTNRLAPQRWEYLAVAGPTTTNFTATGNPNMKKLEESTFAREGFVLEQHLDKLGAQGWELVSVAGRDQDPVYYFKRPK
ncbi:MAG: hypothetical protein ABI596_06765 [Pyrinomonadaceae bacterium]